MSVCTGCGLRGESKRRKRAREGGREERGREGERKGRREERGKGGRKGGREEERRISITKHFIPITTQSVNIHLKESFTFIRLYVCMAIARHLLKVLHVCMLSPLVAMVSLVQQAYQYKHMHALNDYSLLISSL